MDVNLRILGTEEAVEAFNELTSAAQKKVFKAGIRKSANIILKAAKNKLSAGKRATSKKRVEKAFRMEDITDTRGQAIEGVNIGNTSFIARWLEGGTKQRKTKARKVRIFRKQPKPRNTGKVSALHFLEEATEEKGEEALNSIAENINAALEKVTKKQFRKP